MKITNNTQEKTMAEINSWAVESILIYWVVGFSFKRTAIDDLFFHSNPQTILSGWNSSSNWQSFIAIQDNICNQWFHPKIKTSVTSFWVSAKTRQVYQSMVKHVRRPMSCRLLLFTLCVISWWGKDKLACMVCLPLQMIHYEINLYKIF